MKKALILFVAILFIMIGCAREVHETHEYNKVVSNVAPVSAN